MSPLAEAATALYGAWRLACRDPGGLRFMDTSAAGARRSFRAALFALPAAIPLMLMRLSYFPPRADTARVVAVEIIAYAIGWTAFPVIVHAAARVAERAHRYAIMVAAYNWVSLAQVLLLLVATPITLSGLLPAPVDSLIEFALRLALLAYMAFTIRVALDLSWGAAIGLALVEFMLGLSIFRTLLALEDAWPLPPGAV